MKSFPVVALFLLTVCRHSPAQTQYSGYCATCVVTASNPSIFRTPWQLIQGTGALGSVVTLLPTPSRGLYVVTVSANQNSLGTCTTGGVIHLEFGYRGYDQGATFTIGSTPDLITMAYNAGTSASKDMTVQGSGGMLLAGGWHSIPLAIYADSGTALTMRAYQTTASSGGPICTGPIIYTEATVQGPY